MAPGVGPLPAAESEVSVAESFARHAAAIDARTLRRLRLAIRLFEWLPFPWRFSRADLSAREQFLAELERSRLSAKRDLLLLMKVLAGVH